jgi:hypothetical protein
LGEWGTADIMQDSGLWSVQGGVEKGVCV